MAALQEMTRLSDDGNQALCELYENGLRGNDLRALHGNFRQGHYRALIHLVKNHHLSVNQALGQITGITEEAARRLSHSAYSEPSASASSSHP